MRFLKHVPEKYKLLPLAVDLGEKIVNIASSGDSEWRFAFFITRLGQAKRLTFEDLKYTNRAKRVMTLQEGDEIAQVCLTTGNDDLLIVTRHGQALRVSENEFRAMGRTAKGVMSIILKNDDKVLSCDVVDDRKKILVKIRYRQAFRVQRVHAAPQSNRRNQDHGA